MLLRRYLGGVLREYRAERNLTLHEVAKPARVSKGYLSELERGKKEASSEVLAAVAAALNVPLSQIVLDVGLKMAASEGIIPDTVPSELVDTYGSELVEL